MDEEQELVLGLGLLHGDSVVASSSVFAVQRDFDFFLQHVESRKAPNVRFCSLVSPATNGEGRNGMRQQQLNRISQVAS